MSVVKLLAQTDERGLAATAVACLDRCIPLLDEADDQLLRPLWQSLVDGAAWPERLAAIRSELTGEAQEDTAPPTPSLAEKGRALVLGMLDAAPAELPAALADPDPETPPGPEITPDPDSAPNPDSAHSSTERESLRTWADACSLTALRVHALLDLPYRAGHCGYDDVAAYRDGRTEGITPLVAAELRCQSEILELLAEHGSGALRRALDASTQGRRVLRAALSRRSRAGWADV